MHLEFVGRWSSVRENDDEDAWMEVVDAIDREQEAMEAERGKEENQERRDPFGKRRVCILRAGLHKFGADDIYNSFLYLVLVVMPWGHAFELKEAVLLMFDN